MLELTRRNWYSICQAQADAWNGQSEVFRWARYTLFHEWLHSHEGDYVPFPQQSVLQHSFGMTDNAITVVHALRAAGYTIDGELVIAAAHLHDDGERLNKKKSDEPFESKTTADDLDEYWRFRRDRENRGRDHFRAIHAAYLLQFVTKPEIHRNFPADACIILRRLKREKALEARVMTLLERWEAIAYGIIVLELTGKPLALVLVLRNIFEETCRLANAEPKINLDIWTPAIERELREFMQLHVDIPPERELVERFEAEHASRAS